MANAKDIKIVFMGTPEISAEILEHLITSNYNVVGLICQPDKPVGRNGRIEFPPTKVVAKKYNVPIYQPISIKRDYEFLKGINPDLIITLAYGQIVPQGVLDIPRFGCVNIHGSILPKYRGAAPIHYSLINNDTESGVTLMEMTMKLDAGDILAIEKVKIDEEDNMTSLYNKMTIASKILLDKNLSDLVNGKLKKIPQDESEVSFCSTIKPAQEKLNFDLNINEILGWIRALSDEPGAYFYIEGIKYKVFKAKIVSNKRDILKAGEIINADKHGLIIQCRDGQLSILDIQKEGKKRMDVLSFLNGNRNLLGKKVS